MLLFVGNTHYFPLLSLRVDWPPTTTMKAIDYWSAICYYVVFTALVEYCVVLYIKDFGKDSKTKVH